MNRIMILLLLEGKSQKNRTVIVWIVWRSQHWIQCQAWYCLCLCCQAFFSQKSPIFTPWLKVGHGVEIAVDMDRQRGKHSIKKALRLDKEGLWWACECVWSEGSQVLELENLWAEAQRAWQPPGMLPTSPGQDLPEASVALFDLEMDLMLTPVQVCQAFQDICQRPTALIIKTPWLTSDLTRAWIFWCCNNQNSSPAKYSGLGGLAHHRCNLLTFFDRHCY